MKLLTALILSLSLMSAGYAAETKKDPAENQNCVKKDKKGKCPPVPKGTKPKPKKKSA